MTVRGYDPYVRRFEAERQRIELCRDLVDMVAGCDFVVVAAPLDPSTRGLVGARELAAMRPDAYLVVVSRGGVVDEAALGEALRAGTIAGAGIDVFDPEPARDDHPLFGLENVTFTPHSAGPTWENWTKAFRNAFDNVQRVARGDKPLWVIPELR